MLQVFHQKYILKFTFDAGTSRGILTEKETYFIKIEDDKNPGIFGLGECSTLKKLSIDDVPDYEEKLTEFCKLIEKKLPLFNLETTGQVYDFVKNSIPATFPSIIFGFETALLDFIHGGKRVSFPSGFADGNDTILINGLIWMGKPDFMKSQIDDKLQKGYTTIKLKIGAIDFEEECKLLEYIRKQYSPSEITLRVDANGAFQADEALEKLRVLSQFQLHSIEQPIKQGQWENNRILCDKSPIPIALDEELIGMMDYDEKRKLLSAIQPQFIILKPSLLGGFAHCNDWIQLAENLQIGWWITSALESNIGLNAISQFTATFKNPLPQGLGTGQLYHNNIPSPLEINRGFLCYNTIHKAWNLDSLVWNQ